MLIARIDEPVLWKDRVATRVGVKLPICNCHLAFQDLRAKWDSVARLNEELCGKNATQSEPLVHECPGGDAET